jgi:hypothetical protein
VGDRGTGRRLVEGPIEEGAESLPGPVTLQHGRWTARPPTVILMGA